MRCTEEDMKVIRKHYVSYRAEPKCDFCLAGTVVPERDIELAFGSGVARVCVC